MEAVGHLFIRRNEMNNLQTSHYQCVGDQAAMASPPQCFSAHQTWPHSGAHFRLDVGDRSGEFFCIHEVRVVSECLYAPRGVPGRTRAARTPPASKPVAPEVIGDAAGRQIAFEILATELWVPPRSREPAHVHKPVHLCGLENRNEFFEAASSVPNGEDAKQWVRPVQPLLRVAGASLLHPGRARRE